MKYLYVLANFKDLFCPLSRFAGSPRLITRSNSFSLGQTTRAYINLYKLNLGFLFCPLSHFAGSPRLITRSNSFSLGQTTCLCRQARALYINLCLLYLDSVDKSIVM